MLHNFHHVFIPTEMNLNAWLVNWQYVMAEILILRPFSLSYCYATITTYTASATCLGPLTVEECQCFPKLLLSKFCSSQVFILGLYFAFINQYIECLELFITRVLYIAIPVAECVSHIWLRISIPITCVFRPPSVRREINNAFVLWKDRHAKQDELGNGVFPSLATTQGLRAPDVVGGPSIKVRMDSIWHLTFEERPPCSDMRGLERWWWWQECNACHWSQLDG